MQEYSAWDLGPYSVFHLKDGNQTLRFLSADYQAGGNYTCIVSNAQHSINRTLALEVDGEMMMIDFV